MTQSDLELQVKLRAGDRCEYCCMHQSLQGATFHVEHVVPRVRGGETSLGNLAWACPSCNLRKSDHTEVTDSQTGEIVSLFNPRTEYWPSHFEWLGHEITALTATARVTIDTLELNHERRLRIRHAEEMFDLFPPGG
jgi:hypothetical protein